MLSTACCFIALAGAASLGDTKELTATHWINNPEYRLHDNRMVALFFFDPAKERSETRRYVRVLNRVSKRKDIVVIGLSRAGRAAVEEFARRYRVRFTLGAGSDAAREFGVTEVPKIIVLDGHDRRVVRGEGLADLRTIAAAPLQESEANPGHEASARAGALVSAYEEQEVAEKRAAALWQAWKRALPEDYPAIGEFAEAAIPLEPDSWTRGMLHFIKDACAGIARDDENLAPSALAFQAFRVRGDGAEWTSVREFEARMDAATVDQLAAEYRSRNTDSAQDLVTRRLAIGALGSAKDRAAARRVLMQAITTEPDPSLRLACVNALSGVCERGDEEVASLLESIAAGEPHVLRTRPMMEYFCQVLRTGESDRDKLEPPDYSGRSAAGERSTD
jgi:hypothetical protein